MRINRLFIKLHRMLGSLLSILFLMWFLTGMVMMYHTYPSVSQKDVVSHAERIEAGSLLPVDSLPARAEAITLERRGNTEVYRMRMADEEQLVEAHTGKAAQPLSEAMLRQTAARWGGDQPQLLDTLHAIDVWLIGAMPFQEYPIYHYSLGDTRKSEVYVSSRTGRVLQFTDRSSRFWAWVGAIPHWIYITGLRAHGRQPWTDTVLWISGFGIAMVALGLVVGIRSMVVARRRRRLTPYVKSAFRVHHVFGLFFGLFVLTWIFSGYMSLADAPKAVWPVHDDHSARQLYADTLHTSLFTLDVNHVAAAYDARCVELMEMGGRPFYHVWTADDDFLVDAADSTVRSVMLETAFCRGVVEQTHPSSTPVKATLMDRYDNYYVSQKQALPLPVIKVAADDADRCVYYINPRNGSCRYYNTNRRAGKWMYSGLHAFNTSFFARHPLLRKSLLWVLLLGGTVVSATGVVLTLRRLRRKKSK